jgi:hypothetical protein
MDYNGTHSNARITLYDDTTVRLWNQVNMWIDMTVRLLLTGLEIEVCRMWTRFILLGHKFLSFNLVMKVIIFKNIMFLDIIHRPVFI